mmetsp:Transcript_38653/g.69203  ORF Transcript_38653/g.69203 Transcript_38653/m.69203 type:complete len:85 (-) Transcript_38653:1021-1275(-)
MWRFGGIWDESGKGLADWRASKQEVQESKLLSIALANIFSAASIAICCCALFSRSASFIALRTWGNHSLQTAPASSSEISEMNG